MLFSSILSVFSTCIKGENVQTAVIVFNDWASQEISLYDDGEVVEVEWTVGPIPINDNIGKEIIMRYDTDIQSQAKYYTDANGREVLERTRDYRPTWNYTVNEPVSGNYYPINSRIWIKDQTRQLTVLTGKNKIRMIYFLIFVLQIVHMVVVAFMMVLSKS
jgi:lysosomal alpha-mannosidase